MQSDVRVDHRLLPRGQPVRDEHGIHRDAALDEGERDRSQLVVPGAGADVVLDGRPIGFVTSVARHHELGPIALALVKRNVAVDAPLLAGGIAAAQEVVVTP